MTISRSEVLLQLVVQDPNDGTNHYMLGNEYFKAQRYAEAVHTLRRYLQLADDEGAAYRLLAQSLERIGDLDGVRGAQPDDISRAVIGGGACRHVARARRLARR